MGTLLVVVILGSIVLGIFWGTRGLRRRHRKPFGGSGSSSHRSSNDYVPSDSWTFLSLSDLSGGGSEGGNGCGGGDGGGGDGGGGGGCD